MATETIEDLRRLSSEQRRRALRRPALDAESLEVRSERWAAETEAAFAAAGPAPAPRADRRPARLDGIPPHRDRWSDDLDGLFTADAS